MTSPGLIAARKRRRDAALKELRFPGRYGGGAVTGRSLKPTMHNMKELQQQFKNATASMQRLHNALMAMRGVKFEEPDTYIIETDFADIEKRIAAWLDDEKNK